MPYLLLFFISFIFQPSLASESKAAITQPLPLTQLREKAELNPQVQALFKKAELLSQMKLTYLYGSANPKNKGMDCSGTIYYLLKEAKISQVPRQANEMYTWLESQGHLKVVNQLNPDLKLLKPGGLLFWSGTYAVKRVPPITHVMLYLGTNKSGQRLMFGASDGRSYQGKKMWGVSVFDFKLPPMGSRQKFVAYGCIPGISCEA